MVFFGKGGEQVEESIRSSQELKIPFSMTLTQFVMWLKLVADEDQHPKMIRDFCMKTTDESDMRMGLEYLYNYGFYTELTDLTQKNKQHTNPLNQKWALVYELIMARQKRTIPQDKIIETAQSIETDDPALAFLIEHLIMSSYFDIFEYDKLANSLDQIYQLQQEVDNPLIDSFFQIRLDSMLFVYHWKRNEMILARKHGFRLINRVNNPMREANIHLNLCLTYIFDGYENCMYHLNEAKKIAENQNMTRLIDMINHQNIPFVHAHFNQPEGITTPIISEQAHLEIAKGNLQKAKELLAELPDHTPFTTYYLGRASQDKNILMRAYKGFIEGRSDHFFARLPLQAIREM